MRPRNILLITSNNTGMGHRSICSALLEKFDVKDNLKVTVVDGFELSGKPSLGRIYGPMTRSAKEFYKIFWDITTAISSLVEEINYMMVKSRFSAFLDELRPDCIISLHPAFNESVIRVMRNIRLSAIHIALVADLVTIHPLWASRNSDCIICPTIEAKEACMGMGVQEHRLEVFGFPVRNGFCLDHGGKEGIFQLTKEDNRFTCLIMSGGEGVGNLGKIASLLLENYDCDVRVITGRNTSMKASLETRLRYKYPDRIKIYGCIDNVHEVMSDCDIVITRGSPNAMMEAVMCNIPLLITGALPGQEQGNPRFAEKYGLGVSCCDIQGLKQSLDAMFHDDGRKLQEIRSSQRAYRNPVITDRIVDFILNTDWRLRNSSNKAYSVDMS